MGRPSAYTEAVAEEICRRMISGESLASICRSAHMPGESTVHGWIADSGHPFSADYARACAGRGITYGERVAEIGMAVAAGKIGYNEGRVAIDALKWAAGRMAPARFGDRLSPIGTLQEGAGGVLAIPIGPASVSEWLALEASLQAPPPPSPAPGPSGGGSEEDGDDGSDPSPPASPSGPPSPPASPPSTRSADGTEVIDPVPPRRRPPSGGFGVVRA